MAITDFSKMQGNSVTFDEDTCTLITWETCQTDPLTAYEGSKIIAEREAWKFYNQNKVIIKLKFPTGTSSYIFGLQVVNENLHELLNGFNKIINQAANSTKSEDITPTNTQCCHVYDAVKTHGLAIEEENLTDKRLFVTSTAFDVQDILNYLNADFGQLKGKILVGTPDNNNEHPRPGAVVGKKKTRD
ncbi:some similarities with Saccharomyces cerevisiae YOL151W GRE2 3-methylbutanal reductase and NADPH-dependent methylglyoxal reductase (D-lactaldehyde dehydrogenase) [Maudiozyma barnettii]|mgnify:CR=1 FL=1|uniref:Some similarities with Saccharomyces cerevisiae YOL151W GRE2 3-methylbutanal reductase and NADPH-dependent methylglyoxal reductase (D-lactaldehyde dehydrogenase) n=1 Tax=Maudiozyma barnettii TaxID=61262 RepID=A0A8H2VKA2_9SACH|nr:uncharacterized protein KABA2_13S06556 [Kazachstania barnettii]CAB4257254.1 some similarities with Saccharomyces cerevisiae YOL151W GRE2 3-methylbutanal reductase and NADPH-dependent methylglyoxal reductase (D-lactaldehyde dehydrogenase) [Kazachstania barnettii]CAD1779624.1 some similarities with Saccharomyces cerevisiae YOL151W GRE2 3-methylbutanal reductase and NADPH-dependent methylglyoxal reductase (D-lactaldehyde dehydrogenase) [Kazachstania barnettii]